MERIVTTVDPNGELTLPSSIPAALGLAAGAEVEIRADGNCITISPKRPLLSPEEADRALDELQAMFRGQPSLEDELYKMRREEDEHHRRKYGW